MFKLRTFLFAAIIAATTAYAADKTDFQPGQLWSVKNSDIRVVVGRVEPFSKDKTAVSVSILNVPCPEQAGCKTTVIAHAPFDADTLRESGR